MNEKSISIINNNAQSPTTSGVNPDDIKVLGIIVNGYVESYAFGEANRYIEELNRARSALVNPSAEVNDFYYEAILKLKFASLPLQDEAEQIKLLSNSLVFAVHKDIDLKERLSFIFFPYYYGSEDGVKLNTLVSAMENNTEMVGSQTVKNWIISYKNSVKVQIARAVGISTFIAQDEQVKGLSQEDVGVIRAILSVYDWLKNDAVPKGALTLDLAKIASEGKQMPQVPRPPMPTSYKSMDTEDSIEASPKSESVKKDQGYAVARPSASSPAQSKSNNVTPGKIMSRETVDAVTASPESVAQLQKTSRMAYRASAQSLSQAIVNAGQEKSPEGEMRVGQKRGDDFGNRFILDRKSVPEKSTPAPQPSATAMKTPDPAPKSVAEGVGEILKKRAVPEYKQEKSQPANVINLSKKIPLNIARITNPEDLSKIGFSDVNSIGFNGGLNAIGQKVEQLSREQSIPKNLVLNNFYKSPLYETYVNMGVAVMNDKGGDQKAAFEKVLDNYKKAGQDYLTRDQFLAVHALKKKLQDKK